MAVPTRYRAPCAFCGEPVDIRAGRGGYREVSGWEPLRTGGGGNTTALAVRTGRYAHNTCIDVERVQPVTWTQLEMDL